MKKCKGGGKHMEICKDVAALGNLLDNITELYLRTIYKLENLK